MKNIKDKKILDARRLDMREPCRITAYKAADERTELNVTVKGLYRDWETDRKSVV